MISPPLAPAAKPEPSRAQGQGAARAGLLPLAVFLGLFLGLNLLQASLSELTSDEGYYWFLSTRLEWGYYDHPPLLPALIHLGQLVAGRLSAELALRLADVVLVSAALFVVARIVAPRGAPAPRLYLIVLSLPLLHYLTFVAFPDSPLVALSAAFLLLYKRFLEREDLSSAAMMGVVFGLMLNAKYHAALLVLFLVASNPRLLRNARFQLALGIAALLFLPHLYWQYQHEFVTLRYHLFGRSRGGRPRDALEYVSLQALVLGPAVVFVPFVVRARDRFERALKFISLGVMGFFFLATARGYVHFHWTSIAIIPLVILGYHYYAGGHRRLLVSLAIPTAVLVLFLRIYLAWKILPINTFNRIDYYHGRPGWAQELRQIAGDRPVLFENQLREAGLYSFYSRAPGVALYSGEAKKSQWELWRAEDRLQGQSVTLLRTGPCPGCGHLDTRMGKSYDFLTIDRFASYENIRLNLKELQSGEPGPTARVRIEIVNHRDTPLAFSKNSSARTPRLFYRLRAGSKESADRALRALGDGDAVAPRSSRTIEASIEATDLGPPSTAIAFGFDDGVLGASLGSPWYPLRGR